MKRKISVFPALTELVRVSLSDISLKNDKESIALKLISELEENESLDSEAISEVLDIARRLYRKSLSMALSKELLKELKERESEWVVNPDYPLKEVHPLGFVRGVRTKRLTSFGYNGSYLLVEVGNHKKIALHRLIALTFVPNPDPEKFTIVNHLDENKLNNRAENLEWTTYSGNATHGTNAHRVAVHSVMPVYGVFNGVKYGPWASQKIAAEWLFNNISSQVKEKCWHQRIVFSLKFNRPVKGWQFFKV